jgi:hypothetical protein
MRNNWRLGLVLGLAILVDETAARAQGGNTSPVAQAGGAAASPARAGDSNRAASALAQGDDTMLDPSATIPAPPRPSRVPSFNRVTTGRREVVAAPAQTARAAAQAKGAKDRIPSGSSWYEGPQRPTGPPPATVRSTAHNYYPGMRPGLAPNANTPQAARSGQRRPGMSAAALSGLRANTANVARPAPTMRPTPSSSVPAPRR